MSRSSMQIRHGTNAPQNGDLLPYELGITKSKRIYVGINLKDEEGKWVVEEINYIPVEEVGNLHIWGQYTDNPAGSGVFQKYVSSFDINEYPENGQQNGAWYLYKKQLGD